MRPQRSATCLVISWPMLISDAESITCPSANALTLPVSTCSFVDAHLPRSLFGSMRIAFCHASRAAAVSPCSL